MQSDNKVSYAMTNFHSYYGCIKLETPGSSIVIGPINDFPYTEDSLLAMQKEFSINTSNTEEFFEVFHKIPRQNLDTFLNNLLFINYTVNDSKISKGEVESSVDYQLGMKINQKYVDTFYEAKEEGTL